VEILSCMWKSSTGYLPNDEKRLRIILGVGKDEFTEIWDELMPEDQEEQLFTVFKNKIHSKRLDKERNEVLERSQKAKDAAAMRWECERNADAMQTHSERNANASSEHMRPQCHTDTDTDTDTDIKTNPVSPDKSGGHFSDQITTADLVKRIEQSGNLILALSKGNGFKPFQWVQMQLKKYGNPLAITESLEATAKQFPRGFKKTPIAYCQGVFKKLNPTYNEKESKAVSDGFKRIEPDEVLNGLISSIGKINDK